jgi:hypothetical protein
MRAAIEKMEREHREETREHRKPTPTEVRQSRVQFAIHPQTGIPSFSVHCLYCNTGYEDDYLAARIGERMMQFFTRHSECRPGSLPPETRERKQGA